ncbi:ABC transporter permease subunit [Paraburkholderia sp. 22B1P]|uniref:ABC transporter permease n=1 Tax=Paraburkholderia sp. 22B1P TaxID=3080498 RepID=UPI00308FF180|nr:ABC transporter permease [Paraburkholderia sp. 22B1P]
MKAESLCRVALVTGFFVLLEVLCRTGVIGITTMPAPSLMVMHTLDVFHDGKFDLDIATSAIEIVAASLLSIVLGFLCGLVLHSLPQARRAIEPALSSYYAIPTFIFYPVFIVLFGVGKPPIIALAVVLAIVAMVTATLNGLDRLPRALVRSAQVMRLPPWKSVLQVKLPATLPYLFTGVKLSVSYAVIGVIASEFILSGQGVGYAIGYAYNNFQNDDMYALMLIVLVFVTVVNSVLNAMHRRFQSRIQR